jgi:hypothetical protein
MGMQVVLEYFDRRLNENKSEEDRVHVMLVCGSDLLASFNTPGVWSDDDVRARKPILLLFLLSPPFDGDLGVRSSWR